jgi:hypothetical protein
MLSVTGAIMSDHVTLTTHPRFVLIEPRPTPARVGRSYQLVCPPDADVTTRLREAMLSPVVAVDFETRGNDYSLPDSEAYVVGVGLAWDKGSCYLSMDQLSDTSLQQLVKLLMEHTGLVAHNVYFDGGWIRRDLGVHSDWLACTFGLYMQCASEGWEGQKWGLKEAMVDVLMWTNTNETELDEWLVSSGYCKQNKAPMKGEMWRSPPEILGKYCVLDAEATYLLYTEHLLPIVKRFPALGDYHQRDFLPHVKVHIDQKIAGILTDRNHWVEYASELERAIVDSEQTFRDHPLVAPHVRAFEQAKVDEFLATEPARYKKKKERKEPPRFLKDGVTVSKNWDKWAALEAMLPEESKVWQNWEAKRHRIELGIEPGYSFNLQSGDHLRWLMYDKLKHKVLLQTESGMPAISEDALQAMGDVGQILIGRALKVKELSYVSDYVERVEHRSTIHPSFKMPGTVTGRLAGKAPNLQQLPKTKGTLSGFISRPGHSFVDCDVNALEMVVTAELSQDKNLLALYGPNAKSNDLYLFFASMMPILGPPIVATGYDPYNPTPETIAAAKKQCKRERSIAKLLILSDNYGSGVKKKQKILSLNGVDMSLHEVEEMHNSLMAAKEGVLNYVDWLRDEWRANGGWIENGYGRPICVDEKYLKDILNRVVQSSGHDILQLYSRIAAQLLNEAKLDWIPIVMDWHDESIIEVPDEQVEVAKRIMEVDAYAELNRILGGTCPLKGSAAVAKTLAGIKLED